MPCRASLIIIALIAPLHAAWAEVGSSAYRYDARVAFLNAGELALELNRTGQAYEVAGQFQTSAAISNYYSGNGIFAATGYWGRHGPVTQAYMSRTVSKDDDLKIVLNTEDGARLLDGPDGEFENIDKPEGIDLISALFFTPACYKGGVVNDGEDTYRLELRSERKQMLRGSGDYYRGEVTNCDYNVRDHKNRKRRVVVSLAEIGDTTVAVQVRAKIPVLPDAVFRLRVPNAPSLPIGVTTAVVMAGR